MLVFKSMLPLLVVILAIIAVLALAVKLVDALLRKPRSGRRSDAALPPYRCTDALLSAAERSFFGVLQQVIGTRCLIFAKVRLADILDLPRGTERRQGHLNRIISKHIDFLLCDLDTIRPLLAIELDDSSHDRPHRIKRDADVDGFLKAAGLPLLHMPARRGYVVKDIAGAIELELALPATPSLLSRRRRA